MKIEADILQFYLYKKLIRKQDYNVILEDLVRLKVPLVEYLHLKEYTTQQMELEALAEYYCMPYIEVDMLDIDKNLLSMFSFELMKKHHFLPVSIDKDGVKVIVAFFFIYFGGMVPLMV